MKKCIIIIPTHTFDLKDYEIMSLKQVLSFYQNKYNDIDIAISYPWDLDIYELEKYNINLTSGILTFKHHPYWFNSDINYNKLCLKNDFYFPFVNNYEYMLIYQLDAFIFKDELHYWCNKEYDYIGGFDAVGWFSKYAFNGGLSLRKLSIFNKLTSENDLLDINNYYPGGFQEDQIFTNLIYKNGHNILLEDLVKFAINIQNFQEYFFNLLDPNLPFGCHRFQRSKFLYNICKENINYTK